MAGAFLYIKNQYVLGNFTDADLLTLVARGIITEEERLLILNG